MVINKFGIAKMINKTVDISLKDSSEVINRVFDIITNELVKGNDVRIPGLGKWTIKSKEKRMGLNFHTGESVTISARNIVTFKLSTVLRDRVMIGNRD